jgi:chemotaxis protein methyltransferase CheR
MTPAIPTAQDELSTFLDFVYRRFHYDFRSYSPVSLGRRIGRALEATGAAGIDELRRRIDANPRLFSDVLRFLTVQVSDLFRDSGYYLSFRERIVPHLATYPSLRVWVAGCSTGEEFYSFAILLREEGLLDRTTFYCTDINPEALSAAERGIYQLDRVAKFTENHRLAGGKTSLSVHYTAAYGSIVFDRSLRKRAVFSDHSLATDGVFAEVQVVSCRNVLIYFERNLKGRVLELFSESLCRRSFLGLGSREGIHLLPGSEAFGEFERTNRWYRRC